MTINYFKINLGSGLDDILTDPWGFFTNKVVRVSSTTSSPVKVRNVLFNIEYHPADIRVGDDVRATVWGDTVTEDMEPVVDGSGVVAEHPATILYHLLSYWFQVPAARIDKQSFRDAKNTLGDVRFAFALSQARAGEEILADLAYQARCWLFMDSGKYKLVVRPTVLTTSVRSIGTTGVTGFIGGTTKLFPLGLKQIYNKVIVKYYHSNKDELDPYKRKVIAQDVDSQTEFGIRTLTIDAWAVRQYEWALNIANHYLAWHLGPRYIWQAETYLGNMDLERGDVVAITDSQWGLSGALGVVVGIQWLPGSAPAGRMYKMRLNVLLYPCDFYWTSNPSDEEPEEGEPETPDNPFDPGDRGIWFGGGWGIGFGRGIA
ncbi:hypothetical protein C4571_02205 [Candidatus Parcubacteria bacterium]|nr:MAG: hypothetical protein C4571_02205 [Candidatus Parcubacteria bacterium]